MIKNAVALKKHFQEGKNGKIFTILNRFSIKIIKEWA
jgi:hypothetical protein